MTSVATKPEAPATMSFIACLIGGFLRKIREGKRRLESIGLTKGELKVI